MVAVIDYDAGNIFSVMNALEYLGAESVLTDDPEVIKKCDKIILPGVGAFPVGMEKLREKGLDTVIKSVAKTKPILGICLGMQMLFDKSYEFTETQGLGLIPGEVKKMESEKLKIPQMGWNKLIKLNDNAILNGIEDLFVYFVHSYKAFCEDKYIVCYADYDGKVPALVCNGNVYGAQFHPEKSSKTGLKIIKNFLEI